MVARPTTVVVVLAVVSLLTACVNDRGAADESAHRALVVAEPPSTTTSSTTSTSTSTTVPTTTTAAPTTTAPPTTAPPATTPAAPAPTVAAPPPAPPPPPPPAVTGGVYCLGDSVMLGAGPALFNTLSMCGTVDAAVSRQMRNGGAAASQAAATGASVVVVHLGTNGPVTGADVDGVVGRLGGVGRVVLVTIQTSGTRSYQGPANAQIRAAAGRYGNVRIADWEAASTGQSGYFASDGIHLSRTGAQAFAQVVAGAVG